MFKKDSSSFGRKKRVVEKNVIAKPVNPYFAKRNDDDRWVYFSIFVLIASFLVYTIFFADYFLIENINISGCQNISQEEVLGLANSFLDNEFLFILNGRGYFVVRPNKLNNYLAANISEKAALDFFTVDKKFPRTINIQVKEKIPGLIYSQEGESDYFYLSLDGKLGEKIQSEGERNNLSKFPVIVDQNLRESAKNDFVISQTLADFVVNVCNSFTQSTGENIKKLIIPEVKCQEKQYILEKVNTSGKNEVDAEKANKLEILERYEKGEITGETAIELLGPNSVSNSNENSNMNSTNADTVAVTPIYTESSCNYLSVLTQINIQTETGFIVFLDTSLDLNLQLNNLKVILAEKSGVLDQLNYIDVRFKDRAYYK